MGELFELFVNILLNFLIKFFMKQESKFESIKQELVFEELDERLETVQLLAVADEQDKRCNGRCDDEIADSIRP